MSRTIIDRINARGLANGWHADALHTRAQCSGFGMADLWTRETAGAVAANVPARAVRRIRSDADGTLVLFEFKDGTTLEARVGKHV